MSDEMKPERDLDEAVLALREDYEHTAPPVDVQPEPKEGRELQARRFPKVVSYVIGMLAVAMLVAAVFLFGAQIDRTDSVVAEVEVMGEATAVAPDIDLIAPTPPLLVAPPLPPDAMPTPPAPTPWPTPPIVPDS